MSGAIDYSLVDLSNPKSIEQYGKKLEGMTFRDVLNLGIVPEGVDRNYGDKKYKGGLGTLIEERFFGYKANSDERPDFAEAGVELKTTCFYEKQNGDISAKERLVLTKVPFDADIDKDLSDSHLWEKAGNILLIYYKSDKTVESYDQKIEYVSLFTPPEEDLKIIEEDYELIRSMVISGRANELSEGLTKYLGACTKGATADSMWVDQPYAPGKKAKKRAFSFKRGYMDYVLHHYLMEEREESESIIKDVEILKEQTFDEYVLSLINQHKGKTDAQLCEMLSIPYTRNKAQWTTITYRLLNLEEEKAQEFEKANISVRTIRISKDNKVVESMSLAPFSFEELLSEADWEESVLQNYFEETRFLFVAFKESADGTMTLRGARFWNMPKSDIDGPLYKCWEDTIRIVKEGVCLERQYLSNGKVRIKNNLPTKKENPVAHVRPHAKEAAYLLGDGVAIGNVRRDADRLPDGRYMTKQSFWLNNDYVYEIVNSI